MRCRRLGITLLSTIEYYLFSEAEAKAFSRKCFNVNNYKGYK